MEPARNGLGNKTISATIVTVATSIATTPASASTKQKFGNHTQKKYNDRRWAVYTKKRIQGRQRKLSKLFTLMNGPTKYLKLKQSRETIEIVGARTHDEDSRKIKKKTTQKSVLFREILNDGEE